MKNSLLFRRIVPFIICMILAVSALPTNTVWADEDQTTDEWLLSWSPQTAGTVAMKDFVYGNGIYVAVGQDGVVKTSADGLEWKEHWTGFDRDFQAVTWGNGQFVAFGAERLGFKDISVLTSKDGVNWTEQSQKLKTISIRGAASDGKIFVAVGGQYGQGDIFTSKDGVTWTKRNSGMTSDLRDVAWGGGTFVALGEGGSVTVSKDGTTWKRVSTDQPNYERMWNIAYGNGTFVAVGDYTIIKDGSKWKYVASKGFWSRVDFAKDRFFLSGGDWSDSRKKDEWFRINKTSKDGTKWDDVAYIKSPGPEPQVSFTLHNGTQYVTVADLGVQSSADGKQWKVVKSTPLGSANLFDAAVGNGKMVMVGGNLASFNEKKLSTMAYLQSGPDGKWRGSQKNGMYPLNSVVWTGTRFFGVGPFGTMMASKDGLEWQNNASPTEETMNKVIMADGAYYVTGDKGLIMSSKDGKNWTKHQTGVKSKVNSIAWNGETFVAVGDEGLILVSQNGSRWTKVPGNFEGTYFDIVWGGGNFVVTTSSKYANYSTVLRSPDGQKWTELEFEDGLSARGVNFGQRGISYIGGFYVAVGTEGAVFLSKDAEHWSKQDVLVLGDLYGAIEYQGKIYVIGELGRILLADLKSLHTTSTEGGNNDE